MRSTKVFGKHRICRFLSTVSLMTLLGATSALWSLPVPDPAQLEKSRGSVLLRPGVQVAPARRMLYTMNPSGGIDAVGLDFGELRWASSEAAKPLAMYGAYLIAQTDPSIQEGKPAIVVLDVEDSGRPLLSADLPIPPDDWYRIDDGLGRSMRSQAQIEATGTVSVHWKSMHQPVRGAASVVAGAPAAVANAAPQDVQQTVGTIEIDLLTGAVTVVSIDRSAEVGATDERRASILESSDRLAEVLDQGFQFLSADGAHVLTSARVADDREWDKYRWTVYERATGVRVGMIRGHRSRADFIVVGSTIIYISEPSARMDHGEWQEHPLELRAVDLLGGGELWSRPIRDTAYYGPFPP